MLEAPGRETGHGKAALQGYGYAQRTLGSLYRKGDGVNKDLESAGKRFEKAWGNDAKEACDELKRMGGGE